MESVVIETIATALSVSGGAAWIAAIVKPKYLPFLSGFVNLLGANFGAAENKNES
jgi:hypothetical protein